MVTLNQVTQVLKCTEVDMVTLNEVSQVQECISRYSYAGTKMHRCMQIEYSFNRVTQVIECAEVVTFSTHKVTKVTMVILNYVDFWDTYMISTLNYIAYSGMYIPRCKFMCVYV